MNLGKLTASLAVACIALAAGSAVAQKAIRIGYPVILSGPGALIGEPSLKGAQMYVEEINAKGGVLGRKLELVVRDTKGNADEAVRIARDLILRENVDFLVGTLTSAEGPAVSPVAKENKVVFVVPVVKTDQLAGAREPASVRVPHRDEHDHRGPHGGRAHGQVEREEGGDDEPRLRLRPGPHEGVRHASEKAAARHRDRRPAMAEARRGGLHAVHQRPAREKTRRRVHEPVGRALRHVRQAGEAPSLLRIGELQRHGRRRSGRDRDHQGDGRRLSPGHHRQCVRRVQLGRTGRAQGVHQAPERIPQGRAAVVVADHGLHRHADAVGSDRQGRQHRFRQGRQGDARGHGGHADRQAEVPEQGPPGQPGAVLGQDGEGSDATRSR